MKTNRGTNLGRLAFPRATSLTFSFLFSFFRYPKNRGGIEGERDFHRASRQPSVVDRTSAKKCRGVAIRDATTLWIADRDARWFIYHIAALPLRDAPLFLLA